MAGNATPRTMELFEDGPASARDGSAREPLAAGAMVLRGFAQPVAPALWSDLGHVLEAAPLRHWVTPGGLRMSVAMSNCGALGWVSDRRGYRYDRIDPYSGHAWPPMPPSFLNLATAA